MVSWLQKHAWWIGIVTAFLIALFPSAFTKTGDLVINMVKNYWLQIGIAIIIGLLIVLVSMNAKRAP
jgi:hypothetical protein